MGTFSKTRHHSGHHFMCDLSRPDLEDFDRKGELTAIIETAPEGGYWAICPEVPGANGQGETIDEAKESLRQAVNLILEDRFQDA